MGFDPLTGVLVVLVIAFVVLGLIFLGRRATKAPAPDQGVNAGSELKPHDEGHVGRVEHSQAENHQTKI